VTLLSRLFVLVAVALLPAIAIQMYNEFDLRRARQVEVQNQALSLAKLAAAEQQQIVQGIRQVLIAMSELPSIKARDSQACERGDDALAVGAERRAPHTTRVARERLADRLAALGIPQPRRVVRCAGETWFRTLDIKMHKVRPHP
jgi:hypothetical protein